MRTSKLLSSSPTVNSFLSEATSVGFPVIERTYDKDQLIYSRGDKTAGLYFIVSGKVKVSLLSKQGQEKILYLLSAGEVFGELSLISRQRTERATACEPTRVNVMATDQIRARIERDGQFALRWLQLLCQKIAILQEEVASEAFYPVKHRLPKTLLRLAETFGIRDNGDVHIVGVTHETLAQLLGVGRETVSKLMLSLRAEQLISYRRGCISIREDLLQPSTRLT